MPGLLFDADGNHVSLSLENFHYLQIVQITKIMTKLPPSINTLIGYYSRSKDVILAHLPAAINELKELEEAYLPLATTWYPAHVQQALEQLRTWAMLEQPLQEHDARAMYLLYENMIKTFADPAVHDSNGNTLFMRAVEYGKIRIGSALFTAGANPNQTTTHAMNNYSAFQMLRRVSGTEEFNKKLHANQSKILSLMLPSCHNLFEPVNVNGTPTTVGKYILDWSMHVDDKKITELMLEKGVSKDEHRWTPMMEAALRGKIEMINLLIQYKYNMNHTSLLACKGATALGIALLNGNAEKNSHAIATALINAGADLNAGNSYAHKGEDSGCLYSPPLLVADDDSDSDEDAHSYKARLITHNKPLLIALSLRLYDIASLLVIKGADVNILSFEKKTPSTLAEEAGQLELATLIRGKEARSQLATIAWKTPPDEPAAESNNPASGTTLVAKMPNNRRVYKGC